MLEELLKLLKLNYVNSDITDKNFPDNGERGEVELLYFGRYISNANALKEMKSRGYRPATLHETLAWAKDNWNRKIVVILGSVWEHSDGVRRVGYLHSDDCKRKLCLSYYVNDWNDGCRFAAVHQSELGNLDTWPLETLEINGYKYKLVKE